VVAIAPDGAPGRNRHHFDRKNAAEVVLTFSNVNDACGARGSHSPGAIWMIDTQILLSSDDVVPDSASDVFVILLGADPTPPPGPQKTGGETRSSSCKGTVASWRKTKICQSSQSEG
jgi:hypothetical protein